MYKGRGGGGPVHGGHHHPGQRGGQGEEEVGGEGRDDVQQSLQQGEHRAEEELQQWRGLHVPQVRPGLTNCNAKLH